MINHEHKVKVYYKDIDQMGFVYSYRYFIFFGSKNKSALLYKIMGKLSRKERHLLASYN